MKSPRKTLLLLCAVCATAFRSPAAETNTAVQGMGGTNAAAAAFASTNAPMRLGTNRVFAGTNTVMWFPVGEKFEYNLYWGVVPAGRALLESAWIETNGQTLIAIRFQARTSKIVSAVYTVDDYFESLVDPVSFLPVKWTQKSHEGKRFRDEVTVFEHRAGVAHWKSFRKGTAKDILIDNDTRDLLCLMYFMRSKGLSVGGAEKFRVLVDGKLYDLAVTGMRMREVYVTAFGDIDCLEVKPVAKFGEIFVRKGTVMMWFSTDERHVLTKITGEVPVASVQAILRTVEGPGADDWAAGSKKKKKKDTGK